MSAVPSGEHAAMTAPTELEEPHEAALRIALGMRPTAYEWGDPVIDPRPCPSWCLYGEPGEKHELDPDRPFDALHALGAGPDVPLSRYPAEKNRGSGGEGGWYSCASLKLSGSQYGADDPTVHLSIPMGAINSVGPGANGVVELALTDVHELRIALDYMLDVLEGRRTPVEEQA